MPAGFRSGFTQQPAIDAQPLCQLSPASSCSCLVVVVHFVMDRIWEKSSLKTSTASAGGHGAFIPSRCQINAAADKPTSSPRSHP